MVSSPYTPPSLPPHPLRTPTYSSRLRRGCFYFFWGGRATRASFSRAGSAGSVTLDGDELVGRRRRSSRRLSISQNGMVPLPASAGIPPSDLGASGSCSLPRYSRFPKQQLQFGTAGSGVSHFSRESSQPAQSSQHSTAQQQHGTAQHSTRRAEFN